MFLDIVLSVCILTVSYAMIPQIRYSIKNKEVKISNQTLILNSISLTIMCIIYFYSGLVIGAASGAFTSLSWIILLFLKFKYRGNNVNTSYD